MEKRYQVFISSTFNDLRKERQAVLRGTLELNHMPAGMELFPASDESAWQLIRDVIDASDYYVVVVGGRYGSINEDGVSFTEKEYDYAHQNRKPVLPLLHENPDDLLRARTEASELAWEKLGAFRRKIEKNHTCMYWKTPNDLKSNLILALSMATKRHPAVGWVRADQVPSEATLADVLSLKNRVAQLEAEAEAAQSRPPSDTEDLSQGEDTYAFPLSFNYTEAGAAEGKPYNGPVPLSWNAIFAAVAPSMITDASDRAVTKAIEECIKDKAHEAIKNERRFKKGYISTIYVRDEDVETCIVQFRALGLIHESERKRSIHDKGTYWSLTQYGNHVMVQLRAVRKELSGKSMPGARASADTDQGAT